MSPRQVAAEPGAQLHSPAPLSRDAITHAAIEFIEHRGLERLTMRALAQQLGCGTMSLYRYVANRDDLVGAIIEELVDRSDLPELARRRFKNWQEMSVAAILAYKDLAVAYPGSVELLALAPYDAEPVSSHIERMATALQGTGLTERQAYEVLGGLDAYATGYLLVWARARGASGDASGPAALRKIRDLDEFERGLRVFVAGYEATLR